MSSAPTVTGSGSPLAAAFADEVAKQRKANFVRYAELLAALMPMPGEPAETVAPDPKRLAQLKQLAAALGRSPADVQADTGVIQQVRHHRALIARSKGYQEASAATSAAVEAYDADTKRMLAERRAGYARLYAAYSNVGYVWSVAMDSVRDLNRLLDKHPDLLDHEPPASQRDCE